MNWERVRLGDVCNMKSGGTPSRKKSSFFGGNIKWCKISDIENATEGIVYDTEEKITEEGLSDINGRIFSEGTLLLAMYGSVGKVAFINEQMSVNQAILGINIKNLDILDSNFLYYWFIGERRNLLNKAVGVTLKNISKGIVESLTIPLPPLSVQKEIVEKLDKAAAIREKSKALLAHYDALAESLFIELFGDPISNEKGWEKTNIKDICDIKGGKRVPLKHKLVKYDTGLPYIKAGNIKNGKITLDDLEYLLPETQKMIARYIVDEGDVCITVAGTIGNVGIVPKELDKANLTENANKFVIKHEERLSNYFLCYLFQTEFIQEQIRKRTMAVGVPKLAIFRIEELEIPLPPLSLQVKFAEMVENIEEQKARAKAEIEQSEAVFQALLQESFG